MKISPARLAAFQVLDRIEKDLALSSELLPAYEAELSERDRGLCHQLVLGVLRHQIPLDREIDMLASGKKLDREVRIALRLGLYQMRELDRVPDFSAVNESVELVRKARKTSAAGFVNAILRRAAREPFAAPPSDTLDELAVLTSHPKWLIDKWVNDLGEADARAIAAANNRPPATAFRLTAKAGAEIAGIVRENAISSSLASGAFIAPTLPDSLRELAASGEIYLQDEGSQLVGELTAALAREALLDVCAAPGSKTGLIAGSRPDLAVTACDISERRLETLRWNLQAQGVENVVIERQDGEEHLPYLPVFDTVLVDAPCSGTGTIRHNPEIRYRVTPDDLSRYSRRQTRLLENASQCVKVGGHLVYSTCSLEPEENEAVIEGFLAADTAFRIVPASVPARLLRPDGTARTFPHRDDTDGFFIAVLRREA